MQSNGCCQLRTDSATPKMKSCFLHHTVSQRAQGQIEHHDLEHKEQTSLLLLANHFFRLQVHDCSLFHLCLSIEELISCLLSR